MNGTLTICIPIYNFDVRSTVKKLYGQAVSMGVPIVCIDDGSSEDFRVLNREIASMCEYVELPENVGRSRVRNLFLDYVTEGYMLFMDCDVEIADDCFVSRYAEMCGKGAQVVCGGHVYAPQSDLKYRLKYRYGVGCETRSAAERGRRPYNSFMTGNFMIDRGLLDEIRFDESIKGYGHEDTLMGFCLKQKGVSVLHIDNPVVLNDIDSNEVFLQKTREGVRNLAQIYCAMGADEGFVLMVRLLRVYCRLKKAGVLWAAKSLFKCFRLCLERRFSKGWANMNAFKFYKLGLLIQELGDKE